MTFPHVAVGRDAARGAERCALGKFFAHFSDRARSFERLSERIRSALLERLHFFAPQRDELIFVLHCPREFRQPVSNEQRESEVVAAALCRRVGNASTERGGYSAVFPISVCKRFRPDAILSRVSARRNGRGAPRHMDVDLPQTTSKIDGPLVKQFSIFLPNKVGAMMEVVKLVHAHNAHVIAMSISESTDSAIARIMVSDPEQVEQLFREHNVAYV